MTEFLSINKLTEFMISKRVEGKGVEYTHTDCGPPYKKYNIDKKSQEDFYNIYSKVIGKKNLHITEKPKEVSPLTVDIDFKLSNEHSERMYTKETVKYLIKKYLEVIDNNLKVKKSQKKSFFFEKDNQSEESYSIDEGSSVSYSPDNSLIHSNKMNQSLHEDTPTIKTFTDNNINKYELRNSKTEY